MIIVENLPVPFDRRVWQEAKVLRDGGWTVSVICPASKQYPKHYEMLEGIAIYRHALLIEGRGKIGFLLEYVSALFHEGRLLLKIAFTRGFDVIQVCNPPDILFLNALPYKLFGKRLVFDQHDLCPELFSAKFATKGIFHRLLLLAEKLTVKCADLVIAANDKCRAIVIARCGKDPKDVVTVYSVPERPDRSQILTNTALRKDARLVLGYIGIIGDQDGLDHLVRMMKCLTTDFKRDDVISVVVGDGPALVSVRKLAVELGVAASITFTGYLQGQELLAAMSTFDIGIIPDPVNVYNQTISMNKVFEYSSFGVPSVAYDLSETKRLLGKVCQIADDTTPKGLARACLRLIEDDALRAESGRAAKTLADESFDWARERVKYLAAYQRLADEKCGVESADASFDTLSPKE